MKENKSRTLRIAACGCLAAALVCLGIFVGGRIRMSNLDDGSENLAVDNVQTEENETAETGETAEESTEQIDTSMPDDPAKPDLDLIESLDIGSSESSEDKESGKEAADNSSAEEDSENDADDSETTETDAEDKTTEEADDAEADSDQEADTDKDSEDTADTETSENEEKSEEPENTGTSESSASESQTQETSGISSQTSSDTAAAAEEETPITFASSHPNGIDFTSLQSINPEIYAWIEIPGTGVDYPILQHDSDAENDDYYLTHKYDGTEYIGGAIFTQKTYNGTDFTDPCTVIYGHTMLNGTQFGSLQNLYSGSWGFKAYHEIIIYTPYKTLHYEVYACAPYSTIHILNNYNFYDSLYYRAFVYSVTREKTMNSNCNTNITIDPDSDKIIVLSTCLNGTNGTQRFIVLAVLQDS